MAVDPTRVPLQRFLAVVAAGATIDLGAVYGAIYVRNSDAANALWFAYGADAMPGAFVAADGDGHTQLGHGLSLNLDDVGVRYIRAITAGVLTAGLQIVAVKRPGNSGYGSA